MSKRVRLLLTPQGIPEGSGPGRTVSALNEPLPKTGGKAGVPEKQVDFTAAELSRKFEPSAQPAQPARSFNSEKRADEMSSMGPEPGWYSDTGGGGGQRYWNGTAWTEHRKVSQGAPTPRSLSAARGAGSRSSRTGLSDSRGWIIIGVIVAAVAVGAVVVSNQRDAASYQAGHEDGTGFARTYTALSGDHLPDLNIKIDCGTKASIAHSDGVWWSGGRIEGEELDVDAYEEGCFDAIRALVS